MSRHDVVLFAGMIGGVIAVAVSAGLAVSLPLRGVDYNAANLYTIAFATLAGLVAIRRVRRDDGAGLGWAAAILGVAMLPAIFGWVVLLYLPAFVALVVGAVASLITTRSASL